MVLCWADDDGTNEPSGNRSPHGVSITMKSIGLSEDRPTWNMSVDWSLVYSTMTAWLRESVYEIECCPLSWIAFNFNGKNGQLVHHHSWFSGHWSHYFGHLGLFHDIMFVLFDAVRQWSSFERKFAASSIFVSVWKTSIVPVIWRVRTRVSRKQLFPVWIWPSYPNMTSSP